MFSKIRSHISYANVAVTLALVFAMGGGAYAAGRTIITSIKQIKPSVVKQLKGARGPKGPAGPTGATGPAGPVGATGATGATGQAGVGKEGSVGKEGPQGSEGSPWTLGGTVPTGKMLSGDWTLSGFSHGGGIFAGGAQFTTISFALPLEKAPAVAFIKAPTEAEEENNEFPVPPAGCKGNVEKPEAESGHLCIFARVEVNAEGPTICSSGAHNSLLCLTQKPEDADRFGVLFADHSVNEGLSLFNGTWAVTG